MRVLEGLKTGKSNCRGRSRGRSRGRTRGSTRGPTRGATRGPTRGLRLAFACSVRRPSMAGVSSQSALTICLI